MCFFWFYNNISSESNNYVLSGSEHSIVKSGQSCVTSGEKNTFPKVSNASFEAERVKSGSGNLSSRICVISDVSHFSQKTSTPKKAISSFANVTSSR